MTPELRHMLRDDDLNHEEQKQVLELAIKFHHDRFYKQPVRRSAGRRCTVRQALHPHPFQLLHRVAELGGYPLVIDKSGSQLGRGEPWPIPLVCSTAWLTVWCGAPSARAASKKWPSTPPIRWSTP